MCEERNYWQEIFVTSRNGEKNTSPDMTAVFHTWPYGQGSINCTHGDKYACSSPCEKDFHLHKITYMYFFLIEIHSMVEQPLWGMELQEKEAQKRL